MGELAEIADAIDALLPEFKDGSSVSGLILPTEFATQFKGLTIEAKSIIDDELGLSDFSLRMATLSRSGENHFIPGPSYAAVQEAAEVARRAERFIERRRVKKSTALSPPTAPPAYVDPARIAELHALPADRFDFSRLAELCRELNVAAAGGASMATAMLVRAIVDHVPPALGCSSFAEVASSYAGAKSFKQHMAHLDQSLRKVADGHLHTRIRKRESVPSSIEVDFRAAVGELLREVIRVAGEAPPQS